ncbi:MAG: Bug family tripartite tricarboxylate transporter substrate binding protein [Burkholderiaceae bacterium]
MNFIQRLLMVWAMCLCGFAVAQGYPNKPVKLIVGFPPGGGTDIIARMIAQKLSESLGQQFVVENRPGGTGMIGANAVAKSPADGYTLLMGHVNSQAIAPALAQKPLYNHRTDFATISYVGYVPNVLVVNANMNVKSIKELIALAKEQPEKLTFASTGVGSTNHLAGEMFQRATGVKLVHVPYKGSAPAISDLLAGHITMNFDAMSSVVNFIDQGKMRPLAVTTMERDRQYPQAPTLLELGLKDYSVTNWYGIVAPANTPKEIISKLNVEMNRILTLPDVKTRLDELGTRTNPMLPEKFNEFMQSEIEKYQRVAKENNLTLE